MIDGGIRDGPGAFPKRFDIATIRILGATWLAVYGIGARAVCCILRVMKDHDTYDIRCNIQDQHKERSIKTIIRFSW